MCNRRDAWLGAAYYFWVDINFAHFWGKDSKVNTTGFYDIYKADIEEEDLLNTVFNEEHYFFFIEKINATISKLKSQGVEKRELHKNVNRYLVENVWVKAGIKGIVFEDIPMNKSRIYSEIPPLYYLKRIQIAVYDKEIISNFDIYLKFQC